MSKKEARALIADLIAKYDRLSEIQKNQYNEERTKKDFILPLFRALGWSVEDGFEVIAEEGASKGRVDYAFRIDGVTKFYLEAKGIRENLDDPKYAKQAIDYAYHKSIPWVILTDFQGLKAFNAEWEYQSDYQRNQYLELSHEEYLTKLDRLWILSRESFASGELDRDASEHGGKRKKIPVDRIIAADLAKWRGELASLIRTWNDDKLLTEKVIDESVQRLLDRFIFIRTVEDREIEDKVLSAAVRNWELNARTQQILIDEIHRIFSDFNETYNSELFKPHFVDSLKFEANDLSRVIKELYQNKDGINYDFSAINADVLGRIYEQYLGYIQKKEGQEESGKNSKRKKQGIYYTPTYIVEYIVQNTLGKVLKEKGLREIKELKILDPACGSGSFLIKAFQVMDEWIKAEEGQSPDRQKEFLRKFIILQKNIYGVDLDDEAAEIARLNLLLQTVTARHKLPELSGNIKTGNSLISGTDGQLKKYFSSNFKEKKPFNWQDKFPDVFKSDGFDIIIGNPPYVRVHNLNEADKRYLWGNYPVFKAKSDLYACFIQRSIDLLKNGGLVSFIVSKTWLTLESFSDLRKYILDNCKILSLVSLPTKVFEDANVETVIFLFQKEANLKSRNKNIIKLLNVSNGESHLVGVVAQENYHSNLNFNFEVRQNFSKILKNIEKDTLKLKDCVKFAYGFKTGDDEKFLTKSNENPLARKILRRSDFARYKTNFQGEYVIYDPEKMIRHKITARPGDKERFEQGKILVQDIAKKLVGTIDRRNYYVKDALILLKNDEIVLEYILGLVNSKLMNFWYKNKFEVLSVAKNAVLELPIKKINNLAQKKAYRRISKLVNQMLSLNERLNSIREDTSDWEELKSEIEKTDNKINEEVYKLYGLTVEEIKIVEGNDVK